MDTGKTQGAVAELTRQAELIKVIRLFCPKLPEFLSKMADENRGPVRMSFLASPGQEDVEVSFEPRPEVTA